MELQPIYSPFERAWYFARHDNDGLRWVSQEFFSRNDAVKTYRSGRLRWELGK